MTHESDWKDYKLFIKKNSKLIFIVTILTILMVTGATYLYQRESTNNSEENDVEEIFQEEILSGIINSEIEYGELTDSEREELHEYLNDKSRYFKVVIETEDYEVFRDAALLEEILLQKNVIAEFKDDINTPISDFSELFISVSPTNGSSSLEFSVGTGDEEDNQIISDFYYQFLTNNNSEFLENKNIFFLDSEPLEREIENDEDLIDETPDQTTPMLEVIAIVVGVGVMVGILGGLGFAFLKEMFTKVMPSLYNFKSHNNIEKVIRLDHIVLEDKADVDKILNNLIQINGNISKLVLSDTEVNHAIKDDQKSISNMENADIHYINSLEDLDTFSSYDEVLVLVELYRSSKEWFNKEIEQLKIYDSKVTVIVMPSESR